MKEVIQKIQPYAAADGEYTALVDFILQAVKILHPEFKPPNQWSEKELEREPYTVDCTRSNYGDSSSGITVTHRIEYEQKTSGHAVDEVTVNCYGLPEEKLLELKVTRSYHDPRFIEIRIRGTEEECESITDGFVSVFKQGIITDTETIMMYLKNAKSAIRIQAWRAAEFNALEYLKYEPNNPEALMYLGVARSAQGFEPEGENLLLASLTLDPRNHEAYYNLGVLVMKQGRCLLARDSFQKGLEISPNNHPLLYQLGLAQERLNAFSEALDVFQNALENSPNPDQTWGFSGMDYTEEAKEAIERINSKLRESM